MSDHVNPNLVQIGRQAEDRAAQFLLDLGYAIVTRRFKARRGEIDLIAMDGEVVVFVEVKLRRAPGYIPEESVGRSKLEALQRAMRDYLIEMEMEGREARIDLIAIDADGLRHHKDILAP